MLGHGVLPGSRRNYYGSEGFVSRLPSPIQTRRTDSPRIQTNQQGVCGGGRVVEAYG